MSASSSSKDCDYSNSKHIRCEQSDSDSEPQAVCTQTQYQRSHVLHSPYPDCDCILTQVAGMRNIRSLKQIRDNILTTYAKYKAIPLFITHAKRWSDQVFDDAELILVYVRQLLHACSVLDASHVVHNQCVNYVKACEDATREIVRLTKQTMSKHKIIHSLIDVITTPPPQFVSTDFHPIEPLVRARHFVVEIQQQFCLMKMYPLQARIWYEDEIKRCYEGVRALHQLYRKQAPTKDAKAYLNCCHKIALFYVTLADYSL